jgi:hypothetical protein
MGIIALGYVGGFAAVGVALQIIFKAAGVDFDVTLVVISELSARLYMLIIGIVCPLVYFSYYIAVGVTRKQFAVGIFAAGAALSLCFAVLRAPLLIMGGTFSPLAVLVPALYGAFAFLVGWIYGVGFHYMRLLPIGGGILCGTAIVSGLIQLERLQLPPLAQLWIAVAAILVVGVGLLPAVWRIPVKC